MGDTEARGYEEDIRDIRRQLAAVVPASTLEAYRQADEYRFRMVEAAQSRMEGKIDKIYSARLPNWLLAIAGPVLAVVAAHFLR